MSVTDVADPGLEEVTAFLYREANLLDEHDYDGWEALWTDDALYWVPGESDDLDPATHMSVVYDNRRRISTRIKQLKTGRRYAQSPPSELSRMVTNIEIAEADPIGDPLADATVVTVRARCLIIEGREEGNEIWAARTTYRLRPVDGALRMSFKKVVLVNRAWALPTMAFLV